MPGQDSRTRGVLKLRFFHIFSTFPLTTLMTSDFVVESPESYNKLNKNNNLEVE